MRHDESGLVGKVALGVVIGLFVFVGACVALIGGAANKVSDDANKAAMLRIETEPTTCWLLTVTGTGDSFQQRQQEGCGPLTVELPKGLGANAVVTKRTMGGDLTAVVTVAGKETARQTTNADFGSVTVSR